MTGMRLYTWLDSDNSLSPAKLFLSLITPAVLPMSKALSCFLYDTYA